MQFYKIIQLDQPNKTEANWAENTVNFITIGTYCSNQSK